MIVLIRNPKDAVISYVSLYVQSKIRDFNKKQGDFDDIFIANLIGLSIKRYEQFYRKTKGYDILFLSFDQVTTNLSDTIKQINSYYPLLITVPDDEFNLTKSIIDGGGYHLYPSKERNLIKEKINGVFNRVEANLDECNSIYNYILNKDV